MTEIPSENIFFAAFFLGFLVFFMLIVCRKEKLKAAEETNDTNTHKTSTPDSEKIDVPSSATAEAKTEESLNVDDEPTKIDDEPTKIDDEPTKIDDEPTKIDDLKIVEGIGPKIESLLHDAGITTMRNLASSETDVIKKILDAAGPRFRMHDPKTWSAQAKLIADESWDELKEYQDALNGGRDS